MMRTLYSEPDTEPTEALPETVEAALAALEDVQAEATELKARLGYLNSRGYRLRGQLHRLLDADPARWAARPPAGYRAIVLLRRLGEGDE